MKYLLTVLALVMSNVVFPQAECPNAYDGNGDGAVTISDLLDLLGLFGDADADQDGIWDSVDACVDTGSCNYAANPTEPCAYIDVLGICGGDCDGDGDGDGICDDVDTCVGQLDECGVCNGPGPTEIVIDAITILYDSVYLPQLEEWYVYEFGADTSFSYTCAPYFGDCGDPVSYHGYDYATVLIGEQCWFAENLRSENYANGDAIPTNLSESQWIATLEGAVAVYGEDSECENLLFYEIDACNPSVSLEEWGRLYNAYAVVDLRGLCPSGWHVPSDGEWTAMTDYLGGASVAGKKIKATSGWSVDGGTNSSGFTGLPGGILTAGSNLEINFGAGNMGFWWSSTPGSAATSISNNFMLKHRYVYGNTDYLSSSNWSAKRGYSVRCIKDTE